MDCQSGLPGYSRRLPRALRALRPNAPHEMVVRNGEVLMAGLPVSIQKNADLRSIAMAITNGFASIKDELAEMNRWQAVIHNDLVVIHNDLVAQQKETQAVVA